MNIIRTKTGNNHKQQACSNPCYITKTAKTNWKLSQKNKVLRWIIVSSETAESSETKSWIICCNFFPCFHPSFTFFPLPKPVSRLTRIYHHLINPLTVRVTGAPQMILPPVSSINPCSPMPPGTWRTPGLSIPWCCLSTSSSVCLVFFRLSLCLAKWVRPDLMSGRHDHTTAVCISLVVWRSSCGLIACWILAWTSLLVTWSLYEMHSILG